MNSPVIPPVNQANRPLVSVGSGNQVQWGNFPAAQAASSGSSSGNATSLNTTAYPISSGATPTTAGQLLVWNGTAWSIAISSGYSTTGQMLYNDATYGWSGASGPTTNTYYVWNGSTWTLKTPGVASYLGTTSYPISSGATPSAAGQLLVWNGTAWSIALSSGYSTTGQMLYNDATYGWSGASGPTMNTFYVWNGSSWTLQTPGIAKYINTTSYPVSSGNTPSAAGQLMVWNGTAWSIALSSGYSSTGQMLYNDATYGWSGASGPGNNQYYVWSTAGSGSWTLKTSGVATYLNTTSYPVTATPTAVGQLLYWTGSQWQATLAGGSSPGSMLYWTSAYGWQTTSGPTTAGQYYSWDGSSSWNLTSPSSSGANNSWDVTGSTSISGYTNYVVISNGYGQRGTLGVLVADFFVNGTSLVQAQTYASVINQRFNMTATTVYTNPSGTAAWTASLANNFVSGTANAVVIGIS